MIQAVLDHLWQSTLFALFAGLLAWICRKDRAEIRFALWFAASVKFLIPLPLIVMLGRRLRWESAPSVEISSSWSWTLDQVAQPVSSALAAAPPVQPAAAHWEPASLLWGLWAAGTLILLGRWLWQARSIAKAARDSSPLSIDAPLPVRSAPGLSQPGIFGIFRPVLLFPEAIFAELTPAQLAAILSHELCHWRRRDNLTAAIHMVVQALFWFHPLVWWMGTRLIVERELACDEAVVRLGGGRQDYAEGILRVCKMQVGQPPLFVAGVSGGDLAARIERIMKAPLSRGLPAARKFLLAAAGCLAILGPILLGATVVLPRQILAKEARVDPAILDRYAGSYFMPPFSVLTVSRDGDRFRVQRGRGHMSLFADNEREFSARSAQATLTFVVDGAGRAISMIWRENGEEHVYRRIDQTQAASVEAFREERIAAGAPMPGSEAALRRFLDYPRESAAEIASLGTLRSLDFEGVIAGWDVYHAHFDQGDWEFRLVTSPEGAILKLDHQSFRPAKPLTMEEIAALKSNPPATPLDKEAIDRENKLITDAMAGRAAFPRGRLGPNSVLEFVNDSANPYQLYAVDYRGEFHSYGPLPPHAMSVQKIFDMDKWVVAADREHPLAAYAASPGLTVAKIE